MYNELLSHMYNMYIFRRALLELAEPSEHDRWPPEHPDAAALGGQWNIEFVFWFCPTPPPAKTHVICTHLH